MGVSSILSSLRNNIVGQNSTPTNPSLPTKRTPIELSQDTGPLAGLGYDPGPYRRDQSKHCARPDALGMPSEPLLGSAQRIGCR